MAAPTPRRRPRSTIIGATSVVVVLGLLTTLAVTAEGYDAQETPRLESSVWVTRDDGKYARVNTDLGEIDTVRSVDEPSNVIQAGSAAYVLTQGDRLIWPVDATNPLDLTATTVSDDGTGDAPPLASLNTPAGTRDVVVSGAWVAYRTDLNKVFLAEVPTGDSDNIDPSITRAVNPFADLFPEDDADAPVYEATAVAVSDDGSLVMYSADEQAIRRYDAVSDSFVGDPIAVADAPDPDERVELAIVGERWVLSAPGLGRVWVQDLGAVDTDLAASTVLQGSSSTGDVAYLADANELISIDLQSGAVDRILDASGTPAQPVSVDGVVYAAWLSTTGGTLWSSEDGESRALQTSGDVLDEVQSIVPVIRSNGARAVLNETSSGMLWTLPDGELIPLDQWTIDDSELDVGTVQVDDVAEQEPPVAVADTLGVRRGSLVRLPLLLNDHDPNKKDVLTIDATSFGTFDNAAFGELGLISNNQEAVVRVRADSGTASFTYAVTDGLQSSEPVTVTLTIVPDDQNTAPTWCGVDDCAQVWPTPQVAPGGTITIPVLTGWVDAEGDPIVVTDARKDNPDDQVTIVPKSDGSIAIRHLDPNAAGGTVPITISVSDALGATATRTLELLVTASPALSAAPVALVAGAGEKTTVAVADHVYGGSGSYRLVDATATADGLLVVPNTAAGSIELTAATEGRYSLTYTVQDVNTLAEQSAVIRLTVITNNAPLAMAPITAFVRANEDTTVDVLGAVQNTTGRVLLVSSAITGDTTALSVSVVGQSSVRVSGATPDGLPGRIGTAVVTVTDGAGAIVEGVLTVFLAAPSTGVGPIAVPDTVVVRAGGQVDIPVADNDVSPRGERVMVHPVVEYSEASGELAFVSGDKVRYVAPTKEGTYELRYSIYLGNEPSRLDSATITVTVIPEGSNRSPQPRILEAQVLSEQTVSIPVDGYGVDPDGDPVVLAGVDQPAAGQGVASVGADGRSIYYTAPGYGAGGAQVSFSYTLRDSNGAEATGAVRVGVLDTSIADSAPITYSDYIRTQIGSESAVTVQPLLNDSDPGSGELEIVSLVPNTPSVETNPEYARLTSLIDSETSLKDGMILLHAGDVLGTHSYIYTVQSSFSTSTSQGLIVVTVSDEGAIDYPIVADTVITAKNRSQLAAGIDVVSGKVQWPTGDVSTLELSIWGGSNGFSADGQSISGPLPKNGGVVVFALTGEDASGREITSYGFLRIPALNDMRLQLRSNMSVIEVGEEKSVEFDILDVLDLDSSDTVSVRDDDSFVVQRANSSCVSSGSTKATYTAGREAPWTDYCAVPVRLQGQTTWTILAVPISIAPKDPLAQLNAVSRTIAPGSSETIDLYAAMTSWQGGRVGDKTILDYTTAFGGSSFVVTHEAGVVSIDTRADAKPGTRETINVSVTSYGGLSAAITLVVGIAAPDTPRGATFVEQCDVRTGASCGITVIGQAGQYDPFEGKVGAGLTLVSIGNGGPVSCAVASIAAVGDTRIVATYPAGPKPTGGECIVPYTVKDAQGRTGMGQVTIDILGYPAKPSSITTTDYSPTSVTMTVTLGEAANAHPSLTGVAIYEGSTNVPASCSAGAGSYSCVISGLVNGEHHTYTARAVNSIGESLDTTSVVTNAYVAPVVTSFTAAPVYDAQTSTSIARVRLSITSSSDVLSFYVVNTGETISRADTLTTQTISIAPGSGPVSIIPKSRYNPPKGGSNDGSSATAAVNAIGAPTIAAPAASASTKTTIVVTGAAVNTNHAPSSTSKYFAWSSGATPVCTPTSSGGLNFTRADVASDSATITVPTSYVTYNVMVCATNEFGVATSSIVTAYAGVRPGAPTGSLTYRVQTNPDAGAAGEFIYPLQNAPSVNAPADPDFTTVYFKSNAGGQSAAFELFENQNPGTITVRYCAVSDPSFCSDPATITAQTANTIGRVTFPTLAGMSCVNESDIQAVKNSIGISSGSTGATRQAQTSGGFGPFPDDEVTFRVTWSNGLNTVSSETFPFC